MPIAIVFASGGVLFEGVNSESVSEIRIFVSQGAKGINVPALPDFTYF